MHEEVIISGFGGQGALFAGQLLAYAGMAEGRQVTWIPSYGPEMRGGTAHCTVILSDEEIGAPLIRNPSTAMVMNPPSMENYGPLVKPGGLLIVNSSLIPKRTEREDISVFYIPASDIASELGEPRLANIVLVGTFLAATGILSPESVDQTLDQHISERHRDLLDLNKQALRRGMALATQDATVASPY